jgi:methylase of polypeptide subunit release factors
MATLNTASTAQFVNNFSTHSLSDYFTQRISRFVPRQENLNYIITQESKFEKFSELTKIGEATFDNEEDLIVFSCKYDGPITSRSSRRRQFDIAKKVLQEDFKDGAIFVYHDQYKKFRFSFIRKNYAEKGVNRYSPWKRYTYFVDPAETNKTFNDRIGNCAFSNLETIQEAFSVEKLTKDFYNRLFEWFQWTVSDEVGITFPNDTTIAEDDREKLEVQVIRLTTRLLFVWFIKQNKLVPDGLFNTEKLSTVLNGFDPESRTDGSYYNAILQNLFFATLNKTIEERAFAKLEKKDDLKTLYRYAELFSIPEEEVLGLFNEVPFLNGGLFECLDKVNSDGKKIYLDGFSRNHKKAANGNFKHRAFIPNCVFFDKNKGIIPILEQYNFTVEENDPNEVQVALDPELLGNVFENLLGAFNKETRDSARKQSGSFYTPREIVSYMVDESLVAYLQHNLPEVDPELIRELFEKDPLPEALQQNDELRDELSTTLRKVKILDPACGSGAFPMGILNKMMRVFQKLDQESDQSDTKNKRKNYARKLHLIEECIYGIDIQPIATQISKLRFFISLIVDEDQLNRDEENYGIRSLPNLETKFVAANTLLSPGRRPAKGQFSLENMDIFEKKQDLLGVRKKHFYAPSAAVKTDLRKRDNQLREELSDLLQENSEFATEDAKNLAKWNPYDQNESASFFDLDWMFGLENGFDIVIGNPPYFSLSTDGKDDQGNVVKHNKLYDKSLYSSFANSGDIYGLFYERGWQLLKNNGHLCFITSNKWMRAGYGESTRKFFAENTNPLLLVDFAGQKIFESATVDTNILLFSKGKNQLQTKACIVKEKVLKKLADYIRDNATETAYNSADSWIILSEIEQRIKAKIEAVGTPLKDWDIKINYGIKTGYNEAFIIDGKKRDELIAEDPKSAEIIRPILRGRDIDRYSYNYADRYIITTFPSKTNR